RIGSLGAVRFFGLFGDGLEQLPPPCIPLQAEPAFDRRDELVVRGVRHVFEPAHARPSLPQKGVESSSSVLAAAGAAAKPGAKPISTRSLYFPFSRYSISSGRPLSHASFAMSMFFSAKSEIWKPLSSVTNHIVSPARLPFLMVEDESFATRPVT